MLLCKVVIKIILYNRKLDCSTIFVKFSNIIFNIWLAVFELFHDYRRRAFWRFKWFWWALCMGAIARLKVKVYGTKCVILSVVLYRPLTIRETINWKYLNTGWWGENLDFKEKEEIGDWRKLYNEEFHGW